MVPHALHASMNCRKIFHRVHREVRASLFCSEFILNLADNLMDQLSNEQAEIACLLVELIVA